MTIGGSIFLIALGAILRYAITLDIEGVDLEVIGLILMIAGFAGLAISVLYMLVSGGDDRGQGGGSGPPQQQYRDPRSGPPPR